MCKTASRTPEENSLPIGSDCRRRRILFGLASVALAVPLRGLSAPAQDYPAEVAGVRLPRTPLCRRAYALCRSAAPAFLVNHSLRTYLFGAFHAAHQGYSFDTEAAFVAASLNDLGLLTSYATKEGSFEIDGADAAERLVREQGGSAAEAATVWNAIVMHDMHFAIASHQSPEAALVAAGAGADVIGPDEKEITAAAVREVVAAFPRLRFKAEFIALLTHHCERKPGVQNGTWLEGFCRQHSTVPPNRTERAIRDAPFAE